MDQPRQKIDFHSFGSSSFADFLRLEEPPFSRDPFRQLNYVEQYLENLGCRGVVIEQHYIDRDHMEDHSVFYSRNFSVYENWCRRMHFFSLDPESLRKETTELLTAASKISSNDFALQCAAFSERNYLGFCIIKPLDGSPVGRTVLRCYDKNIDEFKREFRGARDYRPHFMGLELRVRGLAFQQQDTGVSACATTALWSAIQKVQDLEDLAAATPAQITTVASQYSLPFGRTMPSEGLSIDQMCQAIRALGLSPNLFRVENFDIARGLLFSTVMSGMAPILILETPDGLLSHAVTAAGVKLRGHHEPELISGILDEQASDLVAVYVHDDRYGPYLSTALERGHGDASEIEIKLDFGQQKGTERWKLTHILLPMHSKIRLSFQGLRDVGTMIVKALTAQAQATSVDQELPQICMDTRIIRAHHYVRNLLFSGATAREIEEFYSRVSLARYVGVVHLRMNADTLIDLLVDTTDTVRNLHCLAVVLRGKQSAYGEQVSRFLASRYGGVQHFVER
jgi:hypothetical protein